MSSTIPIESESAAASLSLADVPPVASISHVLADVPLAAAEEEVRDFAEPGPAFVGPDDGTVLSTEASVVNESTSGGGRFKKNCWCYSMIAVVVFLALLVLIPLILTLPGSPHGRPSQAQITNYLVENGVSSEQALNSKDSPQYKAVQWMARSDRSKLFLPSVLIDDPDDTSGYLYATRYIMALNYFALDGGSWVTQVNFLTSNEICDWNGNSFAFGGSGFPPRERGGLMCDEQRGLPLYLDLEYNDMSGTIPSENGLLTTLVAIDMDHNLEISGTIPTELCHLTNLKFLVLKDNALTGPVPSCLGKMTALSSFHLNYNKLTGTIPTDICSLTDMTSFALLRNNGMKGPLPSCMSEWTDLTELAMSDNQFTGELPTKFDQLTKLAAVWLDGNQLQGDPTSMISSWTGLELLFLEGNQFSGSIDENFATQLENLTVADLSQNQFSSTGHAIPTHLLQLPKLQVLDLSQNELQGKIPRGITANNELLFLSIHDNQVAGGIPTELGLLSGLRHLDLSSNQFHGPIPDEIFEFPEVYSLFLANNPNLDQGPIPSTIVNMTRLQDLSLKNTNRNGTLPEMKGFSYLSLLDLDNNDFSGIVPPNYGQLPSLQYLLLNRNKRLTGNMPEFNTSTYLQVVLMDATEVVGDFTSICERPVIAGGIEVSGEDIVVTDCDDDITCSCCHCCTREETGCSDPDVANWNYQWEREIGLERSARNFAVNKTYLEDPFENRNL